jgi:probable HAF family extracellular repeat protein
MLPVRWSGGVTPSITRLPTLGGPSGVAYDINDAGQIVGQAEPGTPTSRRLWPRGFVAKRPDHRSGNHQPGPRSSASAINNRGQIVGLSSTAGAEYRAFLYENGRMYDLNRAIPSGSGWVLEAAQDINENGQIVGGGTLNGQPALFLLTPQ